MRGWRALLRIALRESLRAKGRTALICLLIGLPIAAATAVHTLVVTAQVSPTEAPDLYLGSSQALVTNSQGRVTQSPDPYDGYSEVAYESDTGWGTLSEVRAVLGQRAYLPIRQVHTYVLNPSVESALVVLVDRADPLADGMVELVSGRWPEAPDEVAVSQMWARDNKSTRTVRIAANAGEAEASLQVVGTVRWTEPQRNNSARFLAPTDSIAASTRFSDAEQEQSWLVGGDPVSWSEVTRLNDAGFVVVSRAVLADPPMSDGAYQPHAYGVDVTATLQWVGLSITLALLEIALLAGPAMAVGLRRTLRSTALMVVAGGSVHQVRGIVLARALVLGLWAAGSGLVVGLLAAWVAPPVINRFTGIGFGPYDVRPLPLLGYVVVGVLSAVLAGTLPAWRAARFDPVRSLTGAQLSASRSGDGTESGWARLWSAPSWWGLLLAAASLVLMFVELSPDRELRLLWAVVLMVIAMTLLVPVGIRFTARFMSGAPATVRYVVRDSARHGTRTIPAVAAVAAAVLGVVTLGVAGASSSATARNTVDPPAAEGFGRLSVYRRDGKDLDQAAWAEVANRVRRLLPTVTLIPVRRIEAERAAWLTLSTSPAQTQDEAWNRQDAASEAPTSVIRADIPVVDAYPGITDSQRAQVKEALAAGNAALLGRAVDPITRLSLTVEGDRNAGSRWSLPARSVTTNLGAATTVLVPGTVKLPTGVTERQEGLWLSGAVSQRALGQLEIELLRAGYDSSYSAGRDKPAGTVGSDTLEALVVGVIAALIMLIGAVTATLLALSDAREDLSTLSAVGGTRRDRLGVAATTAMLISGLGLIYGAGFGALTAYAAARMVTQQSWLDPDVAAQVVTFEVPWGKFSLLLLVPIVTVGVAIAVAGKTPAWSTESQPG